jgi:hypothetical protein
MPIRAGACPRKPESATQCSITCVPEPNVRAVDEHVFVPRSALQPEDIAFFSGFLAGDGSFLIRRNNAGASWACVLHVKLRADDTPLLKWFQEWTGSGRLAAAPARGGSHPQTSWIVGRRSECLNVARILDRRPLLGKAAVQFDIWRRAVEISVSDGGASDAIAPLAAELGELHRSTTPVPCPVDITDSDLAPFLSGFASAEAHFGATAEGSPCFALNLRADDGPLLRLFRDTFEIGRLKDVAPYRSSRAAVSWRTGRREELKRLVSWLDKYPPRGRAGYVYAGWRQLVMTDLRTSVVRRAFAVDIRRRRDYRPARAAIEQVPQAERRRRRAKDALRAWAESAHYPGSAVDYEHWRRRSGGNAPTRNTIAAAFGSWLAALNAAGLDTVRSRSAAEVDAIREAAAPIFADRRARARAAILDAVRCCTAELGREPRATEFLRWRAERASDTPSQMTIYRNFPGGFAEVLKAAREADADELAA